MQSKHVPSLNTYYWIALILASIFGANTGDYFSDGLGLGHINGLPLLFALFVLVLVAEHFDTFQHHAYYWLAIIIARTSATNLGDIFHDFHISFLISIPCLSIALFSVLLLWKLRLKNKTLHENQNLLGTLQTDSFYWISMLLAGTLGTVIGDYFSYPLQLGNLYATLVLGTVLAITFVLGRHGKLSGLLYFWFTVVMIRSVGTSGGDYFANHVFGLPLSTILTGIVFISFLIFKRNKL